MKFKENLQEIIKKRLLKLNAERLWLKSAVNMLILVKIFC
jgi:hypothetical protein